MQQVEPGDWYIPALQASFLVAFVLLAPWVGRLADSRPKPRVLFGANTVKAFGAGLLLLKIEPLIAYALLALERQHTAQQSTAFFRKWFRPWIAPRHFHDLTTLSVMLFLLLAYVSLATLNSQLKIQIPLFQYQ